jgi:intein/homing endonuclease
MNNEVKVDTEVKASGVGLDCGTGFLVSCRINNSGDIETKSVRDSFLELEPKGELVFKMMKKGLDKSGVSYIQEGKKLHILGEDSLNVSIEKQMTVRRPMEKGVISPREAQALPLFKMLLKELLGEPVVPGEVVVYSIPAPPDDAPFDVEYHKNVIERVLEDLGYKGKAINEAQAIVFSELEEEDYTGIAISCLPPEQEILTREGFKAIGKVKVGEEILGGDGNFDKVYSYIKRPFSGDMYELKVRGYSVPIKLTYNHRVKVLDETNNWIWKEAQDLEVGDKVMQPGIQYKRDYKRNFIYLNKNKFECKRTIQLSKPLCRLIGYFLGDGHISSRKKEICFTLNEDEKYIIEDIKDIVTKLFKRKVQVINKKGSKAVRVQFSHCSFAKWLDFNCYSFSREKIVPFKIETLKLEELIGLLQGLISTDGSISEDTIGFTSTSKNLAANFHFMLNRLGIFGFVCARLPRVGILKGVERAISGNKLVYDVKVNGLNKSLLKTYLDSITKQRVYNQFGSFISEITDITCYDYTGDVVDIGVDSSSSFCLPFITLHNCGSGMTNICIANMAEVISTFSVSKGGDYIDFSAATSLGYDPKDPKSCDVTPSLMTYTKEQGISIKNPGDDMAAIAISSYYKALIKYMVESIANKIESLESKPKFLQPIKIVVSGGTSLAGDFLEVFKEEFKNIENRLPFEVKEVCHARKPLEAVAEGAFIALAAEEE